MSPSLDFYFDFSSPYGYLASTRIDALGAKYGRGVHWRPFLLGPLYQALGYQPFDQPGKKAYFLLDVPRSARYFNVDLKIPQNWPADAHVAASRLVYWLNDRDPAKANAFGKAAYAAYWSENRRLRDLEVVVDVAVGCGLDGAEVRRALGDPVVKDRLRLETDKAVAAGVFGSPFIIVDGTPFWGSDRLDQLERWLATGGW